MTEAGLGSVMTSKIYLRGIPYVQSLWVASDVSPFSYQRLAQVGVLNVRSFVDNGISDAGANDRCMPCDADVGAYDGVLLSMYTGAMSTEFSVSVSWAPP